MRGNMNHTISISHYSLIKSFYIFFLNFLDVNICAKNISFTEFFSILMYRLTTIQLLLYIIICWINPLSWPAYISRSFSWLHTSVYLDLTSKSFLHFITIFNSQQFMIIMNYWELNCSHIIMQFFFLNTQKAFYLLL